MRAVYLQCNILTGDIFHEETIAEMVPLSLTFILLLESNLVSYNSFLNLRNFPSSFKKCTLI